MHRDGKIVVGSTIAVRYRDEGKDHIATAIALQKPLAIWAKQYSMLRVRT